MTSRRDRSVAPGPTTDLPGPVEVSWAPRPNTLTTHVGSTPPGPVTSVFAAVVDPSGHVLVVDVRSRGWDLPGGHVEAGEDARSALRRELAEEAGVTLPESDGTGGPAVRAVGWLRLHVTAPRPDGYSYPYPDSTMTLYLVELPDPMEPVPALRDEIAAARFLPPARAIELCAGRVWASLLGRVLASRPVL